VNSLPKVKTWYCNQKANRSCKQLAYYQAATTRPTILRLGLHNVCQIIWHVSMIARQRLKPVITSQYHHHHHHHYDHSQQQQIKERRLVRWFRC